MRRATTGARVSSPASARLRPTPLEMRARTPVCGSESRAPKGAALLEISARQVQGPLAGGQGGLGNGLTQRGVRMPQVLYLVPGGF